MGCLGTHHSPVCIHLVPYMVLDYQRYLRLRAPLRGVHSCLKVYYRLGPYCGEKYLGENMGIMANFLTSSFPPLLPPLLLTFVSLRLPTLLSLNLRHKPLILFLISSIL